MGRSESGLGGAPEQCYSGGVSRAPPAGCSKRRSAFLLYPLAKISAFRRCVRRVRRYTILYSATGVSITLYNIYY